MQLFRGEPHACNYLPGNTANSVFLDPRVPLTTELYGRLLAHGFRRSGPSAYRPACPNCTACVPLRIDVVHFKPSRSQRRAWQRNSDLTVTVESARYSDEYFALYRRYLSHRHAGGGMEQCSTEDFCNFLLHPGIDTRFHTFRLNQKLIAVAVVDHVADALSAVYTFYDPDLAARSLGTYAVLREIHAANEAQMRWVYLGFWIAESRKMAYKAQFGPAEGFQDNQWKSQQLE